jgi:hypothetical protein
MLLGSSKRGTLLVALAILGSGCVNLTNPPAVADCRNGGGCVNGGKDTGVPVDTALAPDTLLPVDTASADTLPAPDTKPAKPDVVDAQPSQDSQPDLLATDVSPDGLIVDAPAAVVDALPDALPMDAGVADTLPALPDTRPDVTIVPDAPVDAATVTDTKPSGDAGTATVSFSAGRGMGAMTGYGWVTLGELDTISSPICVGNVAITNAAPCLSTTLWSTSDSLCMTGYVPALSLTTPDYVGNWGVQVGVNAKEPIAAIGVAYSSITVNLSGAPLTDLRAQLHRAGDPAGTTYCFMMTPGVPIPLTSFNTKCWEPAGGVAFTAADAAKIDKVGVQVSSTTAGNIAVTNLCLKSIVFGG